MRCVGRNGRQRFIRVLTRLLWLQHSCEQDSQLLYRIDLLRGE